MTITAEELQRCKQQRTEIGKLCREVFERIRPELIDNNYKKLKYLSCGMGRKARSIFTMAPILTRIVDFYVQ